MSALPTETIDGFCPWCPVRGFDFYRIKKYAHNVDHLFGWHVVPVTIQITATGDAIPRATPPVHPASTGI